jgi:mannose-6-phosphate isomerase-like protein (cupin superfamily)
MPNKNTFEPETQDGRSTITVNSSFSGAHDYFAKTVLPDDIRTHLHRIKSPTPYANNRDQVFMLVRSGTGKMVVNGLEYRLRANTLINLGPFHRYRFIPDNGKTLEIVDTRMNSGTYVYMIANPYLKMEQFYVTSEPPVVNLTGMLSEIANESMNGLLREMENPSADSTSLCFCYMMDLLGILTEKMPKAYFTQKPSVDKSGDK